MPPRGTAVTSLLQALQVVPLAAADLRRALTILITDYEDAVQIVAALAVGADFIVTRDARDFRAGPVPPRSPADVLALLRPAPPNAAR